MQRMMSKMQGMNWSAVGSVGALVMALLGMYGAFKVLPLEIEYLKDDVKKLEHKVDEANNERHEMANTLTRIDEHLKSIDESLRELKRK